MPRWVTKTVAEGLAQIPGVTQVDINPPGGDYDSENITLSVAGCEIDNLFISAFNPDRANEQIEDAQDNDFPMVEVTDGSGEGGLTSDSEELGIVYVKVRKYFLNQGFQVVTRLKDYF